MPDLNEIMNRIKSEISAKQPTNAYKSVCWLLHVLPAANHRQNAKEAPAQKYLKGMVTA